MRQATVRLRLRLCIESHKRPLPRVGHTLHSGLVADIDARRRTVETHEPLATNGPSTHTWAGKLPVSGVRHSSNVRVSCLCRPAQRFLWLLRPRQPAAGRSWESSPTAGEADKIGLCLGRSCYCSEWSYTLKNRFFSIGTSAGCMAREWPPQLDLRSMFDLLTAFSFQNG